MLLQEVDQIAGQWVPALELLRLLAGPQRALVQGQHVVVAGQARKKLAIDAGRIGVGVGRVEEWTLAHLQVGKPLHRSVCLCLIQLWT
jgi:hypothetical protein